VIEDEDDEDFKPQKKQPIKQDTKKPAQKKARISDDSASSEGGYDYKPVSKPKPVHIEEDEPAPKPAAAAKKEPTPPPKQPEKKKKFIDEDSDEDIGGRWND